MIFKVFLNIIMEWSGLIYHVVSVNVCVTDWYMIVIF